MGFAYPPPGHYLFPRERLVLRYREHWARLVPAILFTMLAVFVLAGLSFVVPVGGAAASLVHTVLWYAQVFIVGRLALMIADWWDDLVMITDERMVRVTGLIASKAEDTPIKKITDRKIHHTLIGNILGYGSITVESAGHKSLQRLRFVPDAMKVYEAIVKLTSKDGLPPPAGGERLGGPAVEDPATIWPEQNRNED